MLNKRMKIYLGLIQYAVKYSSELTCHRSHTYSQIFPTKMPKPHALNMETSIKDFFFEISKSQSRFNPTEQKPAVGQAEMKPQELN